MIITSSSLMPSGYRVHNIEVWVPMGLITASHLLWPFALNPWFLSFSVSFLPYTSRLVADHSVLILVQQRIIGIMARTVQDYQLYHFTQHSHACIVQPQYAANTMPHSLPNSRHTHAGRHRAGKCTKKQVLWTIPLIQVHLGRRLARPLLAWLELFRPLEAFSSDYNASSGISPWEIAACTSSCRPYPSAVSDHQSAL